MAEPPSPDAKPPAKPAPAKAAAPAKPATPAKAPAKAAPGKAAAPAAPAEPAAPTNKAEIRARLRKGRPVRFEVPAAGGVLGRDEAAAVPLPLEGISREHARIAWDGRGWWLEDLKSTNGTFLNGERIVRDRLQHLDVIGLGRKAELVFVLRSLTEAAPETRKAVTRAALVDAEGTPQEVPVGEFTIGRSVACNLRADVNSVSKVHAKVERSSDQVIVTDLSSSNGTFVNGARVRTAVLRDGDVLDLAGVVKFNVIVEQGETKNSGVFRAPTATPKEGQPQFSGEWKTRYEWDPAELAAIAAAAAGVRPAELDKEPSAPAGPRNVVQAGAKRAVAVTPPPPPKPSAPAKPAAPPPKPVVVPAPAAGEAALEQPVPRPVKIASPAAGLPPTPAPGRAATPVGTDPATTPDKPGLTPAPPEVRSPIVPAVEPAGPKAAAPPAKAAVAAPPAKPVVAAAPAPPVAAAPAAPSRAAAIAVVHLAGEQFAFDLSVPGRYEVGRAATAALRVDHTTVSRRHAAISLSEDRQQLRVEDLGAANGTRVNGTPVKGTTQELKDGDVLELGEVRLAVRFDRA